MACYAAVISLKQTIGHLLNSSQISILPSSQEIIEFAYKEVTSLQEFLQRLEKDGGGRGGSSSERVNTLKAQIRGAVCKLEDAIESHVSNQFLISQSVDHEGSSSSPTLISLLDVEEVKQEIHSFTETVKEMEKMMLEELRNPVPEDQDDAVPSRIDHFDGSQSKMVGLFNILDLVIFHVAEVHAEDLNIVSLWGMPGIGKTTVAKTVFNDEFILDKFDCRSWVTIGPKYQLGKALLIDKLHGGGEEILVEDLYAGLKGRKYLIVVDDVWNTEDWYEFKKLLPDDKNGSQALLTTRQKKVAQLARRVGTACQMPLLTEEESWDLLSEKVFGEEASCPAQLEKAGKEIAKKCEGLPLTIVTVADLLTKAERTPEYWNKVAKERENSVFTDAYDKISNVLFTSYKYLPQHLKACFLYMGVFPPSCDIPTSKLIKLWGAEGFLEPNSKDSLMECLEELVSRSVVLLRQQSSNFVTKTCSFHSAFCYLCIREAGKEKFLHVVNSYAKSFTEGIQNQRRLCIHNNILFGIKEVYDSIESISTARSLLCTGPYHQYPVPICFGLRSLRVLDAITVRFYKFPMEVLKLVQLRYLALTCSGDVPASISKLWNLQYLIVRRHMSIIKSSGASSYLPVEIWDMKGLKHLQVMGSNLPNPCHSCGIAFLPNLLTLSEISADSCSKEILKRIPNLKKLGIQIELSPDAAEILWKFDHISCLHQLESLKCVVVNPKIVAPAASVNTTCFFPPSLKKLSLRGFQYPWEYMSVIAKLPRLEVLKLRSYAFKGPEWVIFENEFLHLRYLLLEDTDLERWSAFDSNCDVMPGLCCLIIRHCYKLKEIPMFGNIFPDILVVDCPSLQLQTPYFAFAIQSSSYDGELE